MIKKKCSQKKFFKELCDYIAFVGELFYYDMDYKKPLNNDEVYCKGFFKSSKDIKVYVSIIYDFSQTVPMLLIRFTLETHSLKDECVEKSKKLFEKFVKHNTDFIVSKSSYINNFKE